MFYGFHDWFERFRASSAAKVVIIWLVAMLVVAAIIIALFSGPALLITLSLTAFALYGIYIMSFRLLVGSCVIAVVLKYQFGPIRSFVELFSGKKYDKLFDFLNQTSGLEIAMIVFFFAFTIAFLTGCIRPQLFVVNNSTRVRVDKEPEKKKTRDPSYPGEY